MSQQSPEMQKKLDEHGQQFIKKFFKSDLSDGLCLSSEERSNNVGKWINVKDELPEEEMFVIMYSLNKYGVRPGSLCDGKWLDVFDNSAGDVTHWMPMPGPPEQT